MAQIMEKKKKVRRKIENGPDDEKEGRKGRSKPTAKRKRGVEEICETKTKKKLRRKGSDEIQEGGGSEEDGSQENGIAKKQKKKRKRMSGIEQTGSANLTRQPKELVDKSDDEDLRVVSREPKSRRRKSDFDERLDRLVEATDPGGQERAQSDSAEPSVEGAVAFKYVPPQRRDNEEGSEERIRLERRIRGLLNRLTEAKLESISSDIATLFQVHGRRLATEIISNEIVGACIEGPRGNDQYAAVFAAFVTGLAATVGIDFGAKFMAALATSFEDQYQRRDNLAVRNLALLLSHLHSFQLLPSEILYELLAVLRERFQELDVATILTILQSCGMSLRGDDPVAMKEFVLSIQQRTAEEKANLSKREEGLFGGFNKRVQFMLETICDIKNNKKPTKDLPSRVQMKKWLQKLQVHNVQLRAVSWKGLLDPLKKGQWWLPSAVSSDLRIDTSEDVAGTMDSGVMEAEKLLHLAASQRMNTDSRRAVFCAVMSGEDYIDAFEKLTRMKFSGTQDREILRIIVDCCLQEKLFNKYYVLLAAKLCHYDKNHKFTVQYCVWDHFKQLNAMEMRRSANLARFLAHLVGSHALSLAVLKPIDFTYPRAMTPKVILHFRILFDTLLTEFSEEVIWNCFSRIAAPENLVALRDGLALFLRQQISSMGGEHEIGQAAENLGTKYRLAKKGLGNVAGMPLQ